MSWHVHSNGMLANTCASFPFTAPCPIHRIQREIYLVVGFADPFYTFKYPDQIPSFSPLLKTLEIKGHLMLKLIIDTHYISC